VVHDSMAADIIEADMKLSGHPPYVIMQIRVMDIRGRRKMIEENQNLFEIENFRRAQRLEVVEDRFRLEIRRVHEADVCGYDLTRNYLLQTCGAGHNLLSNCHRSGHGNLLISYKFQHAVTAVFS